jgi:membrane protease YdiL (CAAX protease family)
VTPDTPAAGRAGWPAGLDPGLATVLLALPALLLTSKRWGQTGFAGELHLRLPGFAAPITAHLWWFGCSVVLYLVVPLILARAVPALRSDELGLVLGDVRFGLKATGALLAVMIPVVLIAAHTGAFAAKYPLARGATSSTATFVLYEAAYVAYFLGWEFLFRGFALFPVAARLGVWPAILIQNVPFALLHVGKPAPEAFGSLAAGLVLGLLAWRTRSFLWGFLVHAVVAVAMDVAAS